MSSYLVKIGGSLIPDYILRIFQALKGCSAQDCHKVYLFPGGGEFADLIRKYRDNYSLSDIATHKMALASLDQNAYLIADICKCQCINSLRGLNRIKKYPVVIAPYSFLIHNNCFLSYDLNIDIFSSDSSAIYVSHLLKAQLIVATDVDGVYKKDPRRENEKQELLRDIRAHILAGIKRGGPLDETLPKLINKYRVLTWVINGKHPERLKRLISDNILNIGTVIRPDKIKCD